MNHCENLRLSETVHSSGAWDEASGRKKADFMMDGPEKGEYLADKREFT